MALLSHDEILRIHELVNRAHPAPTRDSLLAGFPQELAMSLPIGGSPSEALLRDLGTLNGVTELASGLVPLEMWLKNAVRLFDGRQEAASLEEILKRCQQAVAATRTAASGEGEGRALLRRFSGEIGRPKLEYMLQRQSIVAHDQAVAARLAGCVELCEYSTGETLIEQDGTDTDLYLILVGEVGVEIRGREVAIRGPGQHVGEMALIDLSQRRSATIRAKQVTVAVRVREDVFSAIANDHPAVWRRLAIDIGQRLRERGNLVRPARDLPVVLLISGPSGRMLSAGLLAVFPQNAWNNKLWPGEVCSGTAPHAPLALEAAEADFGLLIVGPGDLSVPKHGETSPRDRLVFEAEVLVGALGRERVLLVSAREHQDASLLADLDGIPTVEITPGAEIDPATGLQNAAGEIERMVKRLGSR